MECKIIIDKLSGHDTKAKVGKISKKVGDKVQVGDILFSLESGKGNLNYKSNVNGILTEFLVEEGQTVSKNDIVGIIEGEKGEEAEKTKAPKSKYSFGITKPKKEEIACDLLVIGGGPGGYVAAIRGAQMGMKTVLVEKDHLGGTCLNYGCIPTKSMTQSVHVLENIKNADVFGINVNDYRVSLSKIIERKDQVVETLVSGIDQLMQSNNIRVIKGNAVVIDENTFGVKNKKIDATISAKNTILALGSSACLIPIEGADLPNVLTSKEILSLTEIPKTLTIIGGGVIGMEFAFIYRALGVDVTVVEFNSQILPNLDTDIIDYMTSIAEEKGIKIYVNSCADSIHESVNDQLVITFMKDGKKHYINSEKVLMSVGRKANLNSMELEKLNVALNEKKNGIAVNDYMQTSSPSIYAIGDVTNIVQLAHVASHQGLVAVDHMNGIKEKTNYDLVPSAIFTSPEIGHVGLTEKEAATRNIEIKVAKFPMLASGKALAMNETEGFIKLIADQANDIVLGGTIVGAHGTDMIATVTNLIQQKVKIDEAIKVIYAHPTLSEGIHEALLMLKNRGIHFG
ncbi:dihydrolipoyl dehydrogenase [Abyssisolibacter fermentans]|uniref:dihydrolipoyl dehydrogenase n=1 Tax=Abyssisolibacter fermentans TaxID=1766203 RepID=UPI00082998CA|nr:dihydrolipoyl dehydrogenase [Abyssisolibacter fermentans]